MPLYRNKDKIVLFIHIPKTGGSTVEEVLKASGAPQALKYHMRLGYSNATPQHMHWEVMKHWLPSNFYDYSFALVRHPLARITSEYHYRKRTSNRELPDFEIWMNRQLDRYTDNSYILDNHIRPQTEYVGPNAEVFRLEDGIEAPIFKAIQCLELDADLVTVHHARRSERVTLSVTDKTLKRICSFYAVDFERFGYDANVIPKDLKIG